MRAFNCNTGQFCGDVDDWIGVGYMMFDGWQMQNNWVVGMADQSGAYQSWIAAALTAKQPFLFVTPDTRWPQGATEDEQRDNPGDYYTLQANDNGTWARPDRGTWRWSFYEQTYEPFYTALNFDGQGSIPEVRVKELEALVAEAAYYAGTLGTVVSFVNDTRTQHGLNVTDASGLNTSCVPKLPNGTCGSLWEMFKWEKRLETQFGGPLAIGFYFDSRGWGDLMQGTILQFPVPYREMQILLRSPYDYGGVGGQYGAPVGTYGY
jgi:hypothetical protein